MNGKRTIAYFSMEIGLAAGMPTYSGGLGVLAGDTIRAAADLNLNMIAVTLLHRKGYFYQRLDPAGWQSEEPAEWVVDDFLEEMPPRVSVTIEGREVKIRSWKFNVVGAGGSTVPVYFLDSDLPENSDWDRTLTHYLYGSDAHYRLCQEVILGIGGIRMLRALGYKEVERYHMNEGHAGLLTLELLDEQAARAGRKVNTRDDLDAVRQQCVFTTHTPVPAGQDKFPIGLFKQVLGEREEFSSLKDIFCVDTAGRGKNGPVVTGASVPDPDAVNMTYLALNLSHYINGVAKKHGEVSQLMFGGYSIDAITNGVHAGTWAARPFQELFDKHIPGWKQDNYSLRYALSIPAQDLWKAHAAAKGKLIDYVNRETNSGMDVNAFTLGYARRATPYKRGDLIFTDFERLKSLVGQAGPLQIIFAGKAHPFDQPGKEIIHRIFEIREKLKQDVKVAYLANYDMDLGKMMTSGVDVWLNTPQPPLEASGTSGMKAALNGVPSLSILDGWWIEGLIEGFTGWGIGEARPAGVEDQGRDHDALALYDKLEWVVMPLYYGNRKAFIDIMRHAIALNGSFFNTHRMVLQYVVKAYFP
jgi:glycogen phosphorylase